MKWRVLCCTVCNLIIWKQYIGAATFIGDESGNDVHSFIQLSEIIRQRASSAEARHSVDRVLVTLLPNELLPLKLRVAIPFRHPHL